MSAIDKLYGTTKQYDELKKWLKENPITIKIAWDYDIRYIKGKMCKRNIIYKYINPIDRLYNRNGYLDKNDRPIANFPIVVDKWLLKKCPLKWVTDRIKEQCGL